MFCRKKNCERQSLLQFSFLTWSERSGDRTPPKERSGAKRSKATLPKAEAEGRLIAPKPTPPQVERLQRRSGGGGKAENERPKGGRSERRSGGRTPAKAGGRSDKAENKRTPAKAVDWSERPSKQILPVAYAEGSYITLIILQG